MISSDMTVCDIVACIKKPRAAFTKADIKKFIKAQGIRHVNFMYAGGDGRLKTLNFVLKLTKLSSTILGSLPSIHYRLPKRRISAI